MTNTPLYRRSMDPIKMAVFFLIAIFAVSALGLLMRSGDKSELVDLFPYLISCSFALLYALFNSILLINTSDTKTYWIRSMIGFTLMLVGGIGISYLLSGVSLTEAGSYYRIYGVVTIGYFVFLAIMGLIKFLLEWAQKSQGR